MMCGCGNTGNSGWCGFQPCTILLLIVILKNQCLLDTECNPSARNALTLIFLFWLCCSGGFGGFGGFGCNRGNFGFDGNSNFNSCCCCRKPCCCRCCC
jgi:hypothetical protein